MHPLHRLAHAISRPDVMNFELAHTPSLVKEPGFNKVTNCAEAAKYSTALEKKRYGAEARELTMAAEVPPALAKAAVRGGTDAVGKVGVVEINGKCTGYMINPWIIVTAAHCLDDYLDGGYVGYR